MQEDPQFANDLLEQFKVGSHDAFLLKRLMYFGLNIKNLLDYCELIEGIGETTMKIANLQIQNPNSNNQEINRDESLLGKRLTPEGSPLKEKLAFFNF